MIQFPTNFLTQKYLNDKEEEYLKLCGPYQETEEDPEE